MTIAELKEFLEALSYAATIIGIPVAILVFLYQKNKDRSGQEIETYLRANDKYVTYLTLCLQYPELDAFDLSALEPVVVKTGIDIKKLTLFTILISTLETGYLLYRRHDTTIRRSQWQGWSDYMVMWASRPDFRQAWPALGPQFDADFTPSWKPSFGMLNHYQQQNLRTLLNWLYAREVLKTPNHVLSTLSLSESGLDFALLHIFCTV